MGVWWRRTKGMFLSPDKCAYLLCHRVNYLGYPLFVHVDQFPVIYITSSKGSKLTPVFYNLRCWFTVISVHAIQAATLDQQVLFYFIIFTTFVNFFIVLYISWLHWACIFLSVLSILSDHTCISMHTVEGYFAGLQICAKSGAVSQYCWLF